MKNSILRKRFAEINDAWGEQRFGDALELVNALLNDCPTNPRLWVMRANLIELQNDIEKTEEWKEVKQSLDRAAALDPEDNEATLELAHYIFVHEDNAKKAEKYFSQAIETGAMLYARALMGAIETYIELEKYQRAREIFLELCHLVSFHKNSRLSLLNQKLKTYIDDGVLEE